jgi:hypothetical protein
MQSCVARETIGGFTLWTYYMVYHQGPQETLQRTRLSKEPVTLSPSGDTHRGDAKRAKEKRGERATVCGYFDISQGAELKALLE